MPPSRVSQYISTHGASRWLAILEGAVKATCSMQIATSLGTAGYAIWTILEQPEVASAFRVPHGVNMASAGISGPAPAPPAPVHIWFAWFMLAAGLVTAGVSSLGIAAASRRHQLMLNVHVVSLGILLACELCACVAYFLQLQADEHPAVPSLASSALRSLSRHRSLTSDAEVLDLQTSAVIAASSSGSLQDLRSGQLPLLSQPAMPIHIRDLDAAQSVSITKIIAAGGMVMQVLTLTVGCLLASAYSQVEEAAEEEDQADGAGWGVRARQPLLRDVQHTHAGTPSRARAAVPVDEEGAEEWRQRMRERYGVDTSLLSYDPRAARRSPPAPQLTHSHGSGNGRAGHGRQARVAGGDVEGEGGASRCSIM